MIAARNRADLQILIVLGTRYLAAIGLQASRKPPLATVSRWKGEALEALLNYENLLESDPGVVREEHRLDAQALRWLIQMLGS